MERVVFNLIGLPVVPAGPGDPVEYSAWSGPLVGELASAVAVLPDDSPARLAARIHLTAVLAPTRRSSAERAQAVREAGRLLGAARSRIEPEAMTPVLRTYIARFGSEVDPATQSRLFDELDERSPGSIAALVRARHHYPTLLADGQIDRAVGVVEAALSAAEEGGDPLERVEARSLWVRHLLWLADTAAAARSLDELAAELAALGLPEPMPVVRQRRSVHLLGGEAGGVEAQPAESLRQPQLPVALIGADRVPPAELAFRLAWLGRPDRAEEQLARVVGSGDRSDRLDQVGDVELALLGAAARMIGRQDVVDEARGRLAGAGDRLLIHRDGSIVLGPARLWGAVLAPEDRNGVDSDHDLDVAIDLAGRLGGAAYAKSFRPLHRALNSNRPPTQSQHR